MSITDLDEALATAIRQDAFADGVDYENERIIKLLEERCIEWGKSWGGYCSLPIDPEHCQECLETLETIALIKGEK